MHSTFAYGLAKNGVNNGLPNVRRAATVSHIGGRFSSPSSPMHVEIGTAGSWGPDNAFCEIVVTSPTSLAASIAARPHVTPSYADISRTQAAVAAPGLATKAGSASGDEVHMMSKRGVLVDKTNPFIGYFQSGTDEKEARSQPNEVTVLASPRLTSPVRWVPLRTQSSATLSSSSSLYPPTLLPPQKPSRKWIGSHASRLPTFFKQRQAKNVTQQVQPRHNQTKRAAFVHVSQWKSSALALHVSLDDDQEAGRLEKRASYKQTVAIPAAMSSKDMPGVVPSLFSVEPTSASNMSTSTFDPTCAWNSRLKQDFEVMGSLGEGGQGSVFKVRSKVDGCHYAIKKVVLPRASELHANRAAQQALREVRLMASMAPHPNVVRYHTAWTEIGAGVSHTTVSVERGRGSDGLLTERDFSPQGLQHQQRTLLDAEAELQRSHLETTTQSYSLDFSSASLTFDEYSTPGFTFENNESEDEDAVGLCVDNDAAVKRPNELKNEVCARPAQLRAMKAQVILYIQMELCGTAVNSVYSPLRSVPTKPHEPLHQILDQLKSPLQAPQQLGEATHSNLGAWLRSSLETRSAWSNWSNIHQEGLKLFLCAAQGVAHMHTYGVIHRDLKPDNIFIHGNEAKIGDFGLSKSIFADTLSDETVSPREHLQDVGLSDGDHTTALGTFTYASPEQLGYRFGSSNMLKTAATRLESAKYSIKSDIFALGVILLELCCPFSTMMERSQVLTGVRHGVVPLKARQHFALEMELVLRMTSVDPSDRPTSEEVCAQLRNIMATSSCAITPVSAHAELRELQAKLAAAVHQVRDRSKATLQLEALVSELKDKVQNVGIAIA